MNPNNNSSSIRRRSVLRYGMAFVAVAAGFGLRAALTAWIGPGLPTYITFYPAVMVAALLGGFGPGLLATALTALVTAYWILPPEGFAIASPVDRVALVLFIGMGLFMSVVAEFYRRDRRKASTYDHEMALHQSEEQYRTMFNSMLEGFCIIEVLFDAENKPIDYRFLEINPVFEAQTGLRNAQGKRMRELVPEHEAHWFEIYGKIALTGEPARFENEAKALNRWFDVSAYRIGGSDSRKVAILFSDITARKQVEEALKKAHEELERRVEERTAELHATFRYARSLLEASLDPLVTISLEGKISDVNKATELVTGVARKKLIGSNFSAYFTEPEKADAGYHKVMAEGTVTDYPLTVRHTSGRATDVLYNATVYRNEAGQVQGVFAAARDITRLKEAERRKDFTNSLLLLFAQKNSSKEYLDSVVEILRQWSGCQALGIRIVDEHREIPYESSAGFEPGFLKLENRLSLECDACCCTRAILETFEDSDRELLTPGGSYCCGDTVAFANQLPLEKQARYHGNCMKFGLTSFAIVPIRYRDEVIGAIHLVDRRPDYFTPSVVEFIESMSPLIGEALHRFQTEAVLSKTNQTLQTEIAQRERVEEAHLQVLRRLTDAEETERGRISRELHDRLGQDLTGLKLGLQLIRKQGPFTPPIQESVSRLEQLTDGLMKDIHRLAWELHPAVLDDFGLETVLRRYAAEWSENNNVPVDFHSNGVEASRLPVQLETMLYRVAQEALTNVTRHANAKRVSVLLERRPDHVSLIVEDDGGGFDAGIRVSAAHGKLGLLGMRERVTLAGGTLEIESTPGMGTTIFVRVPLKQKPAESSKP